MSAPPPIGPRALMGRSARAPLLAGLAVLAVTWILLWAGQAAPELPDTAAAAETGSCVLPGPEMRVRHMDVLFEVRDEVVRDGRRNAEWALHGCIECHAVADAAGVPVGHDDPRHFCRSCHDQTAVAADCFSCHRATPETADGHTVAHHPAGRAHSGDAL